jgi:hypothetical protein
MRHPFHDRAKQGDEHMSLRDTLNKVAGLLVELPEETTPAQKPESKGSIDDLDARLAATDRELAKLGADPSPGGGQAQQPKPQAKTVEQIVRETEGPNLDQIKVAKVDMEKTLSPDGNMDYDVIYKRASLPETPFSAEQMLEMLASLPKELPLDMKRQTVKVTLNAMGKATGTSPETIVADASRKLAALSAYTDDITKQTADYVAAATMEIANLQKQIDDKRKAIEGVQQKQAQVVQLCTQESDRLDDVLEFFSMDVPPSKYAGQAPPAQTGADKPGAPA